MSNLIRHDEQLQQRDADRIQEIVDTLLEEYRNTWAEDIHVHIQKNKVRGEKEPRTYIIFSR